MRETYLYSWAWCSWFFCQPRRTVAISNARKFIFCQCCAMKDLWVTHARKNQWLLGISRARHHFPRAHFQAPYFTNSNSPILRLQGYYLGSLSNPDHHYLCGRVWIIETGYWDRWSFSEINTFVGKMVEIGLNKCPQGMVEIQPILKGKSEVFHLPCKMN